MGTGQVEHVHRLPMRWADLDQLGHVNNVVYLQYAQEARSVMVDAGLVADVPERQVTVDFCRPLLLGRRPVEVRSTLTGDSLHQIVSLADSGTVFAEVTSSALTPTDGDVSTGVRTEFELRRRDFDAGRLAMPAVFEVLQEVRIKFIDHLFQHERRGRFVVARTEAQVLKPLEWTPAPLTAVSSVSHVGTSSYRMTSALLDPAGEVLLSSRSAMVAFDPQTQRPRPFADHERESLLAELG